MPDWNEVMAAEVKQHGTLVRDIPGQLSREKYTIWNYHAAGAR